LQHEVHRHAQAIVTPKQMSIVHNDLDFNTLMFTRPAEP